MNSHSIDITVLDGLREMLEDYVRSVVSSKLKSRDLYKYAHHYFRDQNPIKTDVMDDKMEESMPATFDDLDEYENRRKTRPVLFGDQFNSEIDKLNLPKNENEKTLEEQQFLQQSISTTFPFRALDYEQME